MAINKKITTFLSGSLRVRSCLRLRDHPENITVLAKGCIYFTTGLSYPHSSPMAPHRQRYDGLIVWPGLNTFAFITFYRNASCLNTSATHVIQNYNPSLTAEPICCLERLCICFFSCEIHAVILEMKWLVTGFQVLGSCTEEPAL